MHELCVMMNRVFCNVEKHYIYTVFFESNKVNVTRKCQEENNKINLAYIVFNICTTSKYNRRDMKQKT